MLTKDIKLKSFSKTNSKKIIKKKLELIIKENSQLIKSLSKNYKDKYNFKKIKNFFGNNNVRLIGMGGSVLGSQAIYYFLKEKIKKKFFFIDNFTPLIKDNHKSKVNNLIISKSGNTLETISNVNIYVKNNDKNIIITQNKPSYLRELATKLKSEIVHHNNFIGGRYSVLSEVGMLPAELMGLNPKKFRQLDNLIKNKNFLNLLINNTASILDFLKKKNLIQ